MYYSLDRFEGAIAVLVDDAGCQHNVPFAALPAGAQEGNIYTLQNGKYQFDAAQTAARRQHVQALLRKLQNNGQAGR